MKKQVTTVGTLIEHNNKILILLRGGKEENMSGTWGLAAGRKKEGDSILETACREIFEETGLKVKKEELIPAGIFKWNQPSMNVTFHAFRLPISTMFEVKLDPNEHIEYRWATKEEILDLKNPIAGLLDLIESLY